MPLDDGLDFGDFDVNLDGMIDQADLHLMDLNDDLVPDHLQDDLLGGAGIADAHEVLDLDHDMLPDHLEVDLDHNMVPDPAEAVFQGIPMDRFRLDANDDGVGDALDITILSAIMQGR